MFIPRKTRIFEELVKQSSIILEAVETFQRMVEDWSQLEEGSAALEKMERASDELVHEITDEIESAFILPLDKEDIKRLTELLDDIMDNLEQVASRLNIYEIPSSNQALKDFSELVLQSTRRVHDGILMIKERKLTSQEFTSCIESLHELENRGDRLHRRILRDMMRGLSPEYDRGNPLSIIKWKEIFQTLEDTLDVCEDLAAFFGMLRIKYGR
ncbi:MAG: DUF47 family protein [Thermoproteota archaeon]